eukprot:4211043-Amphidinium_carterae.1
MMRLCSHTFCRLWEFSGRMGMCKSRARPSRAAPAAASQEDLERKRCFKGTHCRATLQPRRAAGALGRE